MNQTITPIGNPSVNIKLNVDGLGSMGAGYNGLGTMDISEGRIIKSTYGYIGCKSNSTGVITIHGIGSTWKNSRDLYVGRLGSGILNILGGGSVINQSGFIGEKADSMGDVTVNGVSTTWVNSSDLYVGHLGSGTLSIIYVGLVSIAGTLTIDSNGDGDSFINMAGGGMLAIKREADDSLADFLGGIAGTDAIRYWDDASEDWADIKEATYGEDYTLSYLVGGWLDGYTVLTVGAPVHEYYLHGDIGGGGMAGDTDLQMLAKFWQTASGATWRMGDFNGDGAVNDIDAAILAVNYGKNISASGSVPEPSEIACLLGLCLAGIIAALHRHPLRLYDEKRR